MAYNFANEIRKVSGEELVRLLHDRDPESQTAETIRAEMKRRDTIIASNSLRWTRYGVTFGLVSLVVAIASLGWGIWGQH